MIEPSSMGPRSPIRAHHLPKEDQPTYWLWTKAVALVYVAIIAIFVVGFSLHDHHDAQIASRSQATGAEHSR
jgi:hypothetical protein